MMNEFVHPSFEAVMEAHSRIIKRTGGEAGMVSDSNLKYILETVRDNDEELNTELEVVKKKRPI
ncbi:MAG TPA: hypothetical protein VFF30_18650 [Nitrososphaerales archaeon]|nr:hypothetical protein [Nitrososphaerales archaeon]